jgi:uncharacterized protein YegL
MTSYATERRSDDGGYVVLPFYLVCDVSYSMLNVIPQLNTALIDFRDALAKNPILADKVRFGVLDFSDSASVVVPLSDFTKAPLTDQTLSPRGGTSFAAAFDLLQRTIADDAAKLKADGMKMFRPAVFFLTDGQPNPNDDWKSAFDRLTAYDPETKQGFQAYPLFVPFGMGDADGALLGGLVHPSNRSQLFMARNGTDPARAIQAMTEAMLTSILASGNSAVTGAPQHMLPTAAQIGPDIEVYPGGDFVDA